jgi:hypothetical protein
LQCAICLCDCEDDGKRLRVLDRCKHVFHRDCVDNWFTNQLSEAYSAEKLDPTYSTQHLTFLSCPLCRATVYDSPPSILDEGEEEARPGMW